MLHLSHCLALSLFCLALQYFVMIHIEIAYVVRKVVSFLQKPVLFFPYSRILELEVVDSASAINLKSNETNTLIPNSSFLSLQNHTCS
ncbi:hypothetical protein QVD17_05722 [Tagetes erecta]|uniref:Uncharacterized protein n=1 Tax=Tagetes erecta TaxID=13708 RepID=A0AAD8LED1_TARER|nr:hypothetical protein QVD17_05722 [Tagetes erecta]